IARRRPAERGAMLSRWADLLERPAGTLDALLATPTAELETDALLDGFRRLARATPEAALERFGPLRASGRLDAAGASRAALALALGLAWDRRPESLELFAEVRDEELDDYA